MTNRFRIYQRERFPLLLHAPLVGLFCLAVVTFSAGQASALPATAPLVAACLSTLIFFFQLRVADEAKDAVADARYRPHRPVPRGLVTLGELRTIALAGGVVQFVLAVACDVGLVPLLLLVWLYMALMRKEFFAPVWLAARPLAYLLSHMAIMPLIAGYVSAFDWLVAGREVPAGMSWLLLLSFSCGLVLEIGRKIRSPAAERPGIETYSAAWGAATAAGAWVLAAASAALALGMAMTTAGRAPAWLALISLVPALPLAAYFRGHVSSRRAARLIEPASALVALCVYLTLGPLQLAVAH